VRGTVKRQAQENTLWVSVPGLFTLWSVNTLREKTETDYIQ